MTATRPSAESVDDLYGRAAESFEHWDLVREVIDEEGYVSDGKLTQEQLDEALDVLEMTRVDQPQ